MNRTRENNVEIIIRSPGSLVEEIVPECPGLTWNQVFCELNRLSQEGQVRLTAKEPGLYKLSSITTCNSSTL